MKKEVRTKLTYVLAIIMVLLMIISLLPAII